MTHSFEKKSKTRVLTEHWHEEMDLITIQEPATVHHLRDVLRLQQDDFLTIFNGQGKEAQACVTRIKSSEIEVKVLNQTNGLKIPLNLTMAVAMPKTSQRADWLVEKLTELGASNLIWVQFARSQNKDNVSATKIKRWNRLIEAAAKQCNRACLLKLEPNMLNFQDILLMSGSECYLGCVDTNAAKSAKDISSEIKGQNLLLAIGPEGGVTLKEQEQAIEAGFKLVCFNACTLRIETAALAGASIFLALGKS